MRRTRREIGRTFAPVVRRHGPDAAKGRAARRDGQHAGRTGANATGGEQAANVYGTGRAVAPSPEIGPDGTRHGPDVRPGGVIGTGRTRRQVHALTGDERTRREIGRTVAPLDVAPEIRHGMSRQARTVARRSTAGRADRFTPFEGDRPNRRAARSGHTVAPLDVARTSGTAQGARQAAQDAPHVGTGNAPNGQARTPQAANVPRTWTAQAERLRRRRRSGRTERATGRTFALVELSARAGRADRFTHFTGDRPDGRAARSGARLRRTVAPIVRRHETDAANGCAARCCRHPARHRTHGKRHRTRRTSGRATRRTDGRERHRPQTGRERGRHRAHGCAAKYCRTVAPLDVAPTSGTAQGARQAAKFLFEN